jgi:hypothetical protein
MAERSLLNFQRSILLSSPEAVLEGRAFPFGNQARIRTWLPYALHLRAPSAAISFVRWQPPKILDLLARAGGVAVNGQGSHSMNGSKLSGGMRSIVGDEPGVRGKAE